MEYIKKNIIGIVTLFLIIIYMLFIFIDVKNNLENTYTISNLESSYCNIILKYDNSDYEEYCSKKIELSNKTYDTITVLHQVVDSNAFWLFMLISPTLIMLLGVYNANKDFRTLNIKNYLCRKSYAKYLKDVLLNSYVYAFFLPVVMIFLFILSYLFSGHFDSYLAIQTGISTVAYRFLNNPVSFILSYILNLFFISIFYINVSLFFVRINKSLSISIVESSLFFYFLCFLNTFVISGMILTNIFGIPNSDEYFNFLDMYNYVTINSLTIFTLLCFIVAILSTFIIIKIYINKEKTFIRLEENCEQN